MKQKVKYIIANHKCVYGATTIMYTDSNTLPSDLLQRIAMREKVSAQLKFLKILHGSPLSHELILRGSTAIHGVFIAPHHQRFGGDLDFTADSSIVSTFRSTPEILGLPLEKYSTPSGDIKIIYRYDSSTLNSLLLPVDIHEPNPHALPAENGMFHTLHDKEQIPVRLAMPLTQTLAEKIDAITKRTRVTDFIDIWFILRTQKVNADAVRAIFAHLPSTSGFRSSTAIDNLDRLEDTWKESLTPTMRIPVPPFPIVRRELATWLGAFR